MDLDEEDSEFNDNESEQDEEGEENIDEVEGWDDDENVVIRPAAGNNRSRQLVQDNDEEDEDEDESRDKIESISSKHE